MEWVDDRGEEKAGAGGNTELLEGGIRYSREELETRIRQD